MCHSTEHLQFSFLQLPDVASVSNKGCVHLLAEGAAWSGVPASACTETCTVTHQNGDPLCLGIDRAPVGYYLLCPRHQRPQDGSPRGACSQPAELGPEPPQRGTGQRTAGRLRRAPGEAAAAVPAQLSGPLQADCRPADSLAALTRGGRLGLPRDPRLGAQRRRPPRTARLAGVAGSAWPPSGPRAPAEGPRPGPCLPPAAVAAPHCPPTGAGWPGRQSPLWRFRPQRGSPRRPSAPPPAPCWLRRSRAPRQVASSLGGVLSRDPQGPGGGRERAAGASSRRRAPRAAAGEARPPTWG